MVLYFSGRYRVSGCMSHFPSLHRRQGEGHSFLLMQSITGCIHGARRKHAMQTVFIEQNSAKLATFVTSEYEGRPLKCCFWPLMIGGRAPGAAKFPFVSSREFPQRPPRSGFRHPEERDSKRSVIPGRQFPRSSNRPAGRGKRS